MDNINISHEFRYGKIIYNQLDQFVGRSLKLYGEFSQGEADLFGQIVKPGQTVIEIGANIGAHTVHLAQLVGETGRIHAFEPQRLVYQLLAGNIAINSLTNVHCHQKCVGEKPGKIKVPVLDFTKINNWGGLELGEWKNGEEVEQITIDQLNLAACDFMKVDVEGMEQQVLQGAKKTIKKNQPVLYVEADREDKKQELIAYIRELGYKLYWHNPLLFNENNFFHNPENVFQVEQGESKLNIASYNVLCLPNESSIQLTGFDEVE